LSKQYRHGSARHGLVLGYAACNEAQMLWGIDRLREAIDAQRQETQARPSAFGLASQNA